jgi:hypothetical protein
MHKIIAICIFLASCRQLEKKDDQTAAQNFIKEVDSVILISHESYDLSPPDPKTNLLSTKSSLLLNKKLNLGIIKERIKISKEDAINLGKILDERVKDDIKYSACFDPHHTIIAYKNSKISYIDICYSCYGQVSKDFSFEETMSYSKYKKLKKFFLMYNLKYML